MKHVVLVLDLAATFGGNLIQSMKALQARKEISVRYVLPEGARGRDWIPSLTEVHYTDWSLGSLRQVWRELCAVEPVDIVHLHFVGGMNGLHCRMAFSPRGGFVWHLHNHVGRKPGKLAWLKDLAKRYLYHDSYKIGVSKSVSDSVRPYSEEHVMTVYNAMDFRRLEVAGEDDRINTSRKAIRCMIMGNHFERKGVDIAARAVQMLNRGGYSAALYIALNDSRIPEIRAFLSRVLQTDDYDGYIHFLPARNDIATYYRKIDIFLSPSREEGFTYSVVEAAYCGNRVILSKCPGQDDYLNFDIPAFSWVDDPNQKDIVTELRDAILQNYRLPEAEKQKATQQSRKNLIRDFSMDQWVQNILSIYSCV